jgi:hypothetical protein
MYCGEEHSSFACPAKDSDKQYCLVDAFYKKEAEKPKHLRSKVCLIYCRCNKCRNYKL